MDARGCEPVPGVGVIALINVNDEYSRVRLLSYPCPLGRQRAERHPTTEDYQRVVRLAFTEWGLPDRLAVDHDRVFYDNRSPSPFPTRFHLWLVALKVGLVFGRLGQPTDQGLTENSHQLWANQVLVGQAFPHWAALYQALRQRRDFLNNHLPCASLDETPPLVAHPQARIPRRLYRPEWEANVLDLASVYAYLAQGRWFRLVSTAGTVSLGGQVYWLGTTWARQQVEITFDATDQQLVFYSEVGELIRSLPIQGVTPDTLMGELGPLVSLPMFQLALPFSWDDWRVTRLYETLVT
jgi:hypothetical protein